MERMVFLAVTRKDVAGRLFRRGRRNRAFHHWSRMRFPIIVVKVLGGMNAMEEGADKASRPTWNAAVNLERGCRPSSTVGADLSARTSE